MNQPKQKLINDYKTRWNSTFYMFESLLQNRQPISAVLADETVTRVEDRRLDLTTAQWELLGVGKNSLPTRNRNNLPML